LVEITIPQNQIICTEFDGGEGILVDLQTRRYYQLNETALLVWKGLENGETQEQIAAKLTNGYDVGVEHARTSIASLVDRLASYQLIDVR
jgi:hypothetical protein